MNKDIFMLCQSTNEEEALKLDDKRWKANYKWDGERIIGIVEKGNVILFNRRGNLKNKQFLEVLQELKTLPDCIVDGEIISKDNNFNKLQSRAGTKDASKLDLKTKEVPIDFMIFDLLKANGETLLSKPLKERVILLNKLFDGREFENLKVCEYGSIPDLLQKAKDKDMEGIIVKDMESIYEHKRSHYWKKLKLWKEAVITLTSYSTNNAGIRCETTDGIAVQVSGEQHKELKNKLDAGNEVKVYIQYLERTKENKYRFISYRGLVEDDKWQN